MSKLSLKSFRDVGGTKVMVKLVDHYMTEGGLIATNNLGTSNDVRVGIKHYEIPTNEAIVIKVAPSCTIPIKPNDVVYVRNRAGQELRLDGELYVFYEEREVVALSHNKYDVEDTKRINLDIKAFDYTKGKRKENKNVIYYN